MSVLFESPARHPRPVRQPSSRSESTQPVNIQDSFLFGSLKERRTLVVALLTGELITGQLRRFDRYVLVIDDGLEERMIFKQGIACIARAISPG